MPTDTKKMILATDEPCHLSLHRKYMPLCSMYFPAEEDLVLSALEYIIGEKKTKQSYKNARVVV